jgi:Tfp pilus assembly protein PilF
LSTTNQGAHLGFGYHDITPVEYVLTQFGVIAHYVRLAVWPAPLCLDHTWPVATTTVLPPALLVVGMVAVSLWGILRRSWLGFMGGCFFLILAPTSSIVPIKDTLFEHRMYLPLAVVVALVVVCAHRLLELLAEGFSWLRQTKRLIEAIILIGLLVTLSVGTFRRNRDYHGLIAMWTDVTTKSPHNARAFEHLGTANMMRRQPAEAIVAYTRAVEIDADFVSSHSNLANVLLESGRAIEAEQHYRQVLRLDPLHVEAGMNLGQSLKAQGRSDEAIEQFRATTLIKPTKRNATLLARTWVNYGSSIGNQGDFDGAIVAYRESIRLWPEYDHGHYWLGFVLQRLGKSQEAIQHFRRTLQINPQHVRARQALDNALRR